MKMTPRQIEVVANLSRVTSDGSRHKPQFTLDGCNVSAPIRSLMKAELIELQNGRLVEIDQVVAPKVRNTDVAVNAMRAFLCGVERASPFAPAVPHRPKFRVIR